jgi:hypothetical protein
VLNLFGGVSRGAQHAETTSIADGSNHNGAVAKPKDWIVYAQLSAQPGLQQKLMRHQNS